MHSLHGVVTVALPTWWNLGHTLGVVGIMATLLVAVAGWAIILRRQVEQQTTMLLRRLHHEATLEKRLAQVVRVTNDAVWDCDLATGEMWWGEGHQTIFGYAPQDVEPSEEWWKRHIHPDDRDRAAAAYRAAIDGGGERWPAEYRYQRADGTYAYVADRGCILRDAQGKAVRAIGAMTDITRRKRAEEVLMRSEERFRALVENSSDATILADTNGLITYVGPSNRHILGYAENERHGHNLLELVHPEDEPRAREGFAQLLQVPTATRSMELRYRHKDGTWRWIEVVGTNLLEQPSVGGLVINYRDITERRRVEQALRESEERFRTLFEDAPVGMYRTTPDGRILAANPAIVRMLGYSSFEELATRNLDSQGFDPEHPRSEFRKLVERQGEVTGLEGAWCRRDGSVVHVRESAGVIRDGSGKILYYQGTVEDITEHKRAEKALEERTAYFNALIDNSPLAIVALDVQGRISLCNPAFESMFQYKRQEIVGARLDTLVAGEELLGEAAAYTTRNTAGEVLHVTTRRRRQDGSLLDVELHAVPLRVGREIVGALGLYQDITARKQAEEEMRKAKEAAEAANRAKSEFLANMSHELRTPMNGILGMTQLALETDLSSEQREYLGMAKASADSLLTVISDILDFSKVEARKLDLETIPFNLRDRLEEVLKPLSLRAREKNLKLVWDVASDVPKVVMGDPGRIRQVLINLIGNAIKFTAAGKVALRVAKEGESGESVTLRFSVSDTGVGIPADKQNLIFQAFTQADSSTTRKFGGTGLGLAIASQLVELMGGRVWVESEVARGSTFHFTARLGLAGCLAEPVRKSAASPRVAPPAAAVERKSLRILLVDSDAVNRTLAVRLLEKQGHLIKVIGNGPEARRALHDPAAASFDLLLLNVQMSGIDSLETVARIRAAEEVTGGHLPVIAMSAQAARDDCERCLRTGMDGYLPKPLDPQQLFDCTARIMTMLSKPTPTPSQFQPPSGVFDRQAALAYVEGDEELLSQMASLFLDDYPALMAQLRTAIENADAVSLTRAAHTLKGSVGNFGAGKAMEAAQRLERLGREGQLQDVVPAWRELEMIMEEFVSALAETAVELSKPHL